MPSKRFGVEMSSLKAHVVDVIMSGGEDGIPFEAVWQRIFQPRRATRETMKAHVWQINEMLADQGWRIVRNGMNYRLAQIRKRGTAA